MKRNLRKNDLFTVNTTTDVKALKAGHLYVVLSTEMTGGGTGHGPHDIYPDGHEVTCIRVGGPGATNRPIGRTITFYQSGCFNNLVEPVDIELLGKAVRQERFTLKFKL